MDAPIYNVNKLSRTPAPACRSPGYGNEPCWPGRRAGSRGRRTSLPEQRPRFIGQRGLHGRAGDDACRGRARACRGMRRSSSAQGHVDAAAAALAAGARNPACPGTTPSLSRQPASMPRETALVAPAERTWTPSGAVTASASESPMPGGRRRPPLHSDELRHCLQSVTLSIRARTAAMAGASAAAAASIWARRLSTHWRRSTGWRGSSRRRNGR